MTIIKIKESINFSYESKKLSRFTFCSCISLEDLSLIKSSLKNQFLKKGKKIFDRFDEMKNTATNRLEDWLEEDEDINQKSEFKRNSFYNEKEKESFLRNKKYDDPWI